MASRFINMLFGGRLPQIWLAAIAASLLQVAPAVLLLTTPWIAGAVFFAILFGLGSGLASIVGGTLRLELFGRAGYGAPLGWVYRRQVAFLRFCSVCAFDGDGWDRRRRLPLGDRSVWWDR